MTVYTEENKDKVIKKLCELIENSARESIENKGTFLIGVSGGSLAQFLSQGLPSIQTDFTKWKIFFCDERLVPENDADSTFGHYKRTLIDTKKVNLKEDQFVKVLQGVSPQDAADDYCKKTTAHFPDGNVKFDMLLLGMGPDGHTCSLFPGHELLKENKKLVAAILDSPKPPPQRITMTLPLINNAKVCVFAMCGKEKAEMVKRVLSGEDLPSAKVKPTNGKLFWILDQEAGSLIK